MNPEVEIQRYAAAIRNMQLISGAMLMGVVTFLIVALALPADRTGGGAPRGGRVPLVYLAVVFGVVLWGTSIVAPRLVSGAMLKRQAMEGGAARAGGAGGNADRVAQLLGILNVSLIVQVAMLEAGALFAIVAYLVERSSWSLVVAIVLGAALAARIPTRAGVRDWLEHTLRAQDTAGRWR